MFLKKIAVILLGAGIWTLSYAQLAAAPEHEWADDVTGSHVLQVGVDAWRINTSAQEDTTANMKAVSRLQLANSYPVWAYQDVSPWLRFDGGLRVGGNTLLALKYRSDQSTGSRLDEASVDWAYHAFGVKAGVLDPKMSWCRTYDVDSPWVRESNGFCTIQPDNFAKGSAPGVQTYANLVLGDYSFQGLVGIYRPLMFDYAPRETPTIAVASSATVLSHTRSGMALSATNLKNGTEVRLGLMTDSFAANTPAESGGPSWISAVDSRVLFAGLSWYLNSRWALRGTYFTYVGNYVRTITSDTPYVIRNSDTTYRAGTLEANYQLNTIDVVSAAYSAYDYDVSGKTFKFEGESTVLNSVLDGYPRFTTQNVSLSWRRDWGRGLFSVLQFTRAQVDQSQSDVVTTQKTSSTGTAFGLRLGYRF